MDVDDAGEEEEARGGRMGRDEAELEEEGVGEAAAGEDVVAVRWMLPTIWSSEATESARKIAGPRGERSSTGAPCALEVGGPSGRDAWGGVGGWW